MIYDVLNRTQFEDSLEKGKRKTPNHSNKVILIFRIDRFLALTQVEKKIIE